VAATVAFVVFAGTAISVLPAALTDAQTGPDAISGEASPAATWALPQDPWLGQWLALTDPPATSSPSATPSPTATPTAKPKPKPKPITYADTVAGARAYVRARIGTRQYNCINEIFTHESKWNPRAGKVTGAYGIPQAFPGSKMATFGSNWQTSPLTQVKWGIWYVDDRYGSACAAWAFWQAHGWY
jgi:hypothetical protein